jgi:hypothetical protein
MAAAAVDTSINTPSSDWPDRYFHVDQILDRPGPRTDPSFLAGDGVRGGHLDTNRNAEISTFRSRNFCVRNVKFSSLALVAWAAKFCQISRYWDSKTSMSLTWTRLISAI